MTKHIKLTEKQEDKFVEAAAAGLSPSKAIIIAEPKLLRDPNYAGERGRRMLQRPDIKQKIDKKLQKMSPKALKTIDKMLDSDNESIASQNAWKIIEHNIGTPVKRNLNVHASATIEDVLFD